MTYRRSQQTSRFRHNTSSVRRRHVQRIKTRPSNFTRNTCSAITLPYVLSVHSTQILKTSHRTSRTLFSRQYTFSVLRTKRRNATVGSREKHVLGVLHPVVHFVGAQVPVHKNISHDVVNMFVSGHRTSSVNEQRTRRPRDRS